jgi:ribosomal protein L7Ae-like RNA K-turn-binding protein
MRTGGAKAPTLVLEASDTSENTHKRISDRCAYYKTEHIRLESSGTQLAAALGKTSNLAAVAVTDAGLAGEIRKSSGKEAADPVGGEEM